MIGARGLNPATLLIAVSVFVWLPQSLNADPTTKSPEAQLVIIHAGWLLAVPGQPPLKEKTVIIREGKISAIADGYVVADETANQQPVIVDLRNSYVLPGLIDAHVHLTWLHNPDEQLERVEQSDADIALTGAKYAYDTLLAGFTTVRDVGAPNNAIFALRDAINEGRILGPQIIASGTAISSTGGHGDYVGYRTDISEALVTNHICDGVDDCRRAVRDQVKAGANVIKFMATGGVTSPTATGMGQQLTDAEMRAIVKTAHSLGRKVAAHAHQKGGILAALSAGADSIEHGMWADQEAFELFNETGAFFVPTVYGVEYVGETAEEIKSGPWSYLPDVVMAKLLAVIHRPRIVLREAIRWDVKIALGTDAVVFPHGMNAGEFIEYVNAGMSEMESIMSGTVHAAELLGLSDQIGTVEPGKDADIVATGLNPLNAIAALQQIEFVMADGNIVKTSSPLIID